jgi:hypothetical protein
MLASNNSHFVNLALFGKIGQDRFGAREQPTRPNNPACIRDCGSQNVPLSELTKQGQRFEPVAKYFVGVQ